jgi:carnitine O-acetyltransferase
VARNAVGVLSTENRKIWSAHRESLSKNKGNASCLRTIDNALFIVCLDDAAPDNLAELCNNYLCGTYNLQSGVQIGTCTNRWYDKVKAHSNILKPNTNTIWTSCKSLLRQMAPLVSTSSTLV